MYCVLYIACGDILFPRFYVILKFILEEHFYPDLTEGPNPHFNIEEDFLNDLRVRFFCQITAEVFSYNKVVHTH